MPDDDDAPLFFPSQARAKYQISIASVTLHSDPLYAKYNLTGVQLMLKLPVTRLPLVYLSPIPEIHRETTFAAQPYRI